MLLLVAHRGALNSFFFYLLTIVGPKCPFIVTRNITKRVFEKYIDIFDVYAFASLNNPSITPAAFLKRFMERSSKRLFVLFAPSLFSYAARGGERRKGISGGLQSPEIPAG